MQRMILPVLVAALGAAVGCNQQPKAQLDPVPPPAQTHQDAYTGSDDAIAGHEPEVLTIGAAPPPAEPEAITVAPAGSTYKIRKGDTLWAIAKREYGDGQKWQDIAQANPAVNPNRLLVGTTITLP